MKNAIWTCCIVFASLFYAGCDETFPAAPFRPDPGPPPNPGPPPKIAPTAITDTAIVYPNVGVVLSGRVNPNGSPTKYYFEYGSTAAYGGTTEAKDAGSDTTLVSVQDTVAAVAAEPIRHFRMIAFTSEDTSTGGDVSLDVRQAPIAIIPSLPRDMNTYVVAYGLVVTRGLETRCYLEYGLTTAYGQTSVTSVIRADIDTALIAPRLDNLEPGQIYHLRLVAQNSAGTAQSDEILFTSPIPTEVIVEPPTNITSTGAVFNARINTGGRSASCWIEYGLSNWYDRKSTVQAIPAGGTWTTVSIAVDKLSLGTEYHWQLLCTFDDGMYLFTSGDSVLTTSMVPSDPREFIFPDVPGTKLDYVYAYEKRWPYGGLVVRGAHTWTVGATTRMGTTVTIPVTEGRIDTVHSWNPLTDTTYVSIETVPFLVTVTVDSIAVPFPTRYLNSRYKSLLRYLDGTDTLRIEPDNPYDHGYCTYKSGIGLSSYSMSGGGNTWFNESMSLINIVRQ